MKNFVCVLLSCPFLLFIGCADLSERICLLPDGSECFFAQGGISFKVKEDSLFWKNESFDFPLIRLAEVYLIYAEAACELGNGKISDEDLNFSINNTRKRAGIAPLTNALIANVWDAGYWDHEQNKTVCKKMNMVVVLTTLIMVVALLTWRLTCCIHSEIIWLRYLWDKFV